MIKITNLSFSYNGESIIKNLSLHIKKGDFIALIGPNGSGKTTLIKLIIGLLKPKSGDIKFNHQVKLGYVPQKFNIDRNFPVRVDEIIGKNSFDILESLKIKELMDKQFAKLSGGQQQKVMIALALSDNPDILILDEPAIGVDSASLKDFYGLLKKMNNSGKTIILVSHDISAISKNVKSVICLSDKGYISGKAEKAEDLIESVYGKDFGTHKHD